MEVCWTAFTIVPPGWPGRVIQGGITIMKKFAVLLSAGALALSGAVAQAQTRMFVRGTISSLDGDFLGPASKKRADGTLEAISLQVFTPDRRGQVPEGHTPWDLEPGSLMTNAIIGGMVQTSKGRELTLEYKGGSQKVFIPEGIPIFTALPGDRSMLRRLRHA